MCPKMALKAKMALNGAKVTLKMAKNAKVQEKAKYWLFRAIVAFGAILTFRGILGHSSKKSLNGRGPDPPAPITASYMCIVYGITVVCSLL